MENYEIYMSHRNLLTTKFISLKFCFEDFDLLFMMSIIFSNTDALHKFLEFLANQVLSNLFVDF